MKEKVNNELQKLQEELATLDTAVKQIKNAGEISEAMVLSTKEIQSKYSDQLEKILDLYNEFLNKSNSASEENIKKIYDDFQKKINDENAILLKYNELSLKTENLTQDYIQKIAGENKSSMEKIAEDTKERIENQQKVFDEYFKTSEERLNEVINAHKDELAKVDELLNGYLELAQSTATLTQTLENIDFPKRLDEISSLVIKNKEVNEKNKEGIDKNNYIVSAINKLQTENGQKLQTLLDSKISSIILKNVEKQDKKIKSTNSLIWIVFILNILGWGIFVLIQFFPDIVSKILG